MAESNNTSNKPVISKPEIKEQGSVDLKVITPKKVKETPKAEPVVAVAMDGMGRRVFIKESKVAEFKKANGLK